MAICVKSSPNEALKPKKNMPPVKDADDGGVS